LSDVDQIKDSHGELPTEELSSGHDNKAPIESASPTTLSESSVETPAVSPNAPDEPVEKINTPLSGDMPSSPDASSASDETATAQIPADDQVVTPGSDEFLDQLLKNAQPDPEHRTPRPNDRLSVGQANTEHQVTSEAGSRVPPSVPPPVGSAPASPILPEKPLEIPSVPPPTHTASTATEDLSPPRFPSDSEQIDLRSLNNELADRKEAPPAQHKSGSAIWSIIIIVLLVGGALAAYFLIINKPKDLVSSPTGTDSSLLTPSATNTAVTPVAVASGDEQRKTDLTNIQKALEQYYAANKKYPISTTESKTEAPDAALKILVPQYISSLPTDPTTGQKSYLYKSVEGSTYELSAIFDVAPSGISKTEQVADGYKIILTPGDSFEVAAKTSSNTSTTPVPVTSPDMSGL
jgi:hypothetical protein